METNTVILSVQDYNELRDFKNKIEQGCTYYFSHGFSYGGVSIYVSKEDSIKELAEINESLRKRLKELQIGTKKEPTISEIKKMSIWQFLKWRNA